MNRIREHRPIIAQPPPAGTRSGTLAGTVQGRLFRPIPARTPPEGYFRPRMTWMLWSLIFLRSVLRLRPSIWAALI